MDVPSEKIPERPAGDDAQWHTDCGPQGDRNRGLPRHRGRKLTLGEPERLQQGQVASAATDRRNERQGQGDDSSECERPSQEGGDGPDGSVIRDFSRPQDPDHATHPIRRRIERRVDPMERASHQCGVRPAPKTDEECVGARDGALLEVARCLRDEVVVHQRP